MSVEKIELSKIEIDDEIYPRENLSQKTVDSYVESIRAGVKFPSIEMQKIGVNLEDGTEKVKTICLDGWHRISAYREYNSWLRSEKKKQEKSQKNETEEDQDFPLEINEVEVTFYKNGVLNREENLINLIVRSAELNVRHGLKLSQGDTKNQLEKIAKSPKLPNEALNTKSGYWKKIADKFSVTPKHVSECVSSILAAKRMSRNAIIYELSFLGWTQEEIGKAMGITQENVFLIISELTKVNRLIIQQDFYDKKKSIDDIAAYYKLNIPLTWAILLQGKEDIERFKLFGGSEYTEEWIEKDKQEKGDPMLFNVWNFAKLDERLGNKHEMNIPGQIAMNVLYYYTNPGNLVADPMAGGGSTIDACLVMGRKCRAYDEKPHPERKDILKRDITTGFDERVREKADLIFLDPPYGDMVKFESPISFYKFIETIAKESYSTVKIGGKVALVMCDRTKGEYDPYISECYAIFRNIGFKCIQRISCPLGTSSANGAEINKAKENKKMLGRDRVLYVFQKL